MPFLARGVAVLALASSVGCSEGDVVTRPDRASAPDAAPEPTYVGSTRCRDCHAEAYDAWRGSHHDLAMQPATPGTVLGDFGGTSVERHGVTTTFVERDGRFLVHTDGPNGDLSEFEVVYTFGVEPLQQYLLQLPDGRLQALTLAWDTRDRASGGQRWFSLYPDERTPPGDRLHWTGIDQSWNHMCAECHSTALRKRYDAAAGRYATEWAELDVACEACHGPGSEHTKRARAGDDAPGGLSVRLDPPAPWVREPGAATAHRLEPPDASRELDVSRELDASKEVEVCAHCHSRRGTLDDGRRPDRAILDTHRISLLEADLYHPDGQVRDEVYVYGSFLQSRMYAAGVRCSDCHDAHSLELRETGNALCGQCHAPEHFDVPEHHHHPPASSGARCVECHLPETAFMQIDRRRDHSFRVPRPDLSLQIGTPNACTRCHADRDAAWAAASVAGWFPSGRSGTPHYGQVFAAARARRPGAAAVLASLAGDRSAPAIVRATAVASLAQVRGPGAPDAIEKAARDPEALVRMAAAEASALLAPERRLRVTTPLLRDPVRSVRQAAAVSLADVPPELWSAGDRSALAAALGEYRRSLELDLDRPGARYNLALLDSRVGELESARAGYVRALELDPAFTPAAVNLADLLRALGREGEGERVLLIALEENPNDPGALHALGLLRVRQGRMAEALERLGAASERAPELARFTFVYAVALDSAGQSERALTVAERGLEAHPTDPDLQSLVRSLRSGLP